MDEQAIQDGAGVRRIGTYRKRGEATWTCVKAEFQAGVTAPALADKYGVGIKALYARSSKEGWRQGDAAPGRGPEAQAAAAAAELIDVIDVERDGVPEPAVRLAVALTTGALKQGKPHLAAQYALVAESLSRTAARYSTAMGNVALMQIVQSELAARPTPALTAKQLEIVDRLLPRKLYGSYG